MSDRPKPTPVAWIWLDGDKRVLPYYSPDAIKWWLERAARECQRMEDVADNVANYERALALSDAAAAIRKLIGEVE